MVINFPNMDVPCCCEACDFRFEIESENFCPFLIDPIDYWLAAGKRNEYCPIQDDKLGHIVNRSEVPRFGSNNIFGYLQKVADEYCEMEKSVKECRQKLKDWNKDEEIQKIKDSIEHVRKNSLYIMSDSEKSEYEDFLQKHKDHTHGELEFKISCTSIGSALSITCPECGETKTITDYGEW